MSENGPDKAERILEERNRAFRILYDTVLEVVRSMDEEILPVLGRNLLSMARGVSIAFFSRRPEGAVFDLAYSESERGSPLGELRLEDGVTLRLDDSAEYLLSMERMCVGCVEGLSIGGAGTERVDSKALLGKDTVTAACVRDGVVLAVGLLELPKGKRLRLRDMLDTYLDFCAMTVHRSRVQAALKESEHTARVLWDNVRAAIVLVDPERKIVLDANAIALSILGGSRDQVVGSPCATFSCGKGDEGCFEEVEEQDGSVELALKDLRGNLHSVIQTVSRVVIEGKELMVKSFVDITERKEIERKLLQSQKMDAIGRLAGGIAHDINNVMAAIMGSARAMESERGLGLEALSDLENIVTACRRGADLTQNLLGFARKGNYVKEIFSLNDLAERAASLLTASASPKPEVRLLLDVGLKCVEGDRSQVEHAVMNVCMNAVDAMRSGGILTITTTNTRSSRTSLSDPSAPGFEYVMMTVGDTGVGMDAETRRRVFEPFFTTKTGGEGAGLGLSMVYGVLKGHGGEVIIDSIPGEGTTVSMLFPSVDARASAVEASRGGGAEGTMPAPDPGSGVLIVDDESTMLNATGRLLKKMGLKVFRARNGAEALEVYARDADLIDLVILDMIMPVMDGVATFKAMKERHPELRILLCSGYSRKQDVADLLAQGAVGFLRKPFDYEALSKAVAEAFTARRSDSPPRGPS